MLFRAYILSLRLYDNSHNLSYSFYFYIDHVLILCSANNIRLQIFLWPIIHIFCKMSYKTVKQFHDKNIHLLKSNIHVHKHGYTFIWWELLSRSQTLPLILFYNLLQNQICGNYYLLVCKQWNLPLYITLWSARKKKSENLILNLGL